MAEDALAGAGDIVAELLSDDAELRKSLRALLARDGRLHSEAAVEEDTVYRLYYDFTQPLSRMQGHQVLAVNRGEKEGKLKVSIELDRELALRTLRRRVVELVELHDAWVPPTPAAAPRRSANSP